MPLRRRYLRFGSIVVSGETTVAPRLSRFLLETAGVGTAFDRGVNAFRAFGCCPRQNGWRFGSIVVSGETTVAPRLSRFLIESAGGTASTFSYEGRICSLLRYRFLELHLAWYYLLVLVLLLLIFVRSCIEQIRSGEIAGGAVPQKTGNPVCFVRRSVCRGEVRTGAFALMNRNRPPLYMPILLHSFGLKVLGGLG